jgi:heme-degrading monooxygenase HmoA
VPPFIDAFAVPPEADDEFLAAAGATTVHRALRRDVRLRFVIVGEQPLSLDVPFTHHHGVYDVVHEDGDVDGVGGVILINPFEVEPADDESFLAGWHAVRELLAGQRGYLGTRLHHGDGDFRFVNIARWSSPLMLFRATNLPAFAAATARVPFPSHPGLYERVAG